MYNNCNALRNKGKLSKIKLTKRYIDFRYRSIPENSLHKHKFWKCVCAKISDTQNFLCKTFYRS